MELKTEIKEISPVVKQLEITIPADRILSELDKYYLDLKKSVKLKGFRPGKVPRPVLERFYKKQVENEVVNKLITETYETVLKEKNILPVALPIIDSQKFEPEKNLTYTARVEVAPVVDLPGEYLGLEVEQEKLAITDQDVDKAIEQIRNHQAQLKSLEEDRPIRAHDFAVIDFTGQIDGAPFKGGEVQDRLIEITPKAFLPGFTNQLIGLRPGMNQEITLTLPQDYEQKELAGKTVTFQVTIKEIKEKIIPPVDDNFARDMGEFETLTELKGHLKQEITRREEERIRGGLHNSLLQKIMENNPFDAPPSLVEKQTDYLIFRAQSQMVRQGLQIDSSTMINRELKEAYRPIAEFQVKRSFLLAAIAKREGIVVDPAEIKEHLKSHVPDHTETAQSAEEAQEQVKAKVLEEKVLAFLVEKAKITLVDPKKS